MKKLILKVGLSYSTKDLKCIKGSPFDVDDEKAAELLATGRFEELPIAVSDQFTQDGQDDDPDGAELLADAMAKMSKAELMELAGAKNIDVSDCKNKTDIVNRINEVLDLAGMMQMEPED